jgi:hypothetical protein
MRSPLARSLRILLSSSCNARNSLCNLFQGFIAAVRLPFNAAQNAASIRPIRAGRLGESTMIIILSISSDSYLSHTTPKQEDASHLERNDPRKVSPQLLPPGRWQISMSFRIA